MEEITLYGNHYADTTVVSNYFIDEHMKNANDAQIKIYLFLLRCIGAGRSVSISIIADEFNYTEKDVLRALKYWSKQGLLSLDFDENKCLTGIQLHNFDRKAPKATPVIPNAAKTPEKPSYSTDKLLAFKNQEDIMQLLFIAEQYLGKTLSEAEMSSLLYMNDCLSFSAELIEYLVEYCVNNKKKSIRYIEKVALAWAEAGISTVEQAKEYNRMYRKEVYDVLKAFGISGRNPVEAELTYIRKWSKEYGFDTEIITEACSRTMKNTHTPSFAYADNILKNWFDQHVKNQKDIELLDEAFNKSKDKDKVKTVKSSTTKFNNFTPHSYNFTELEEQLLHN